MSLWKVIFSRISGRKPTVNQMDHNTLAKNIRTGSLYVLKESEGGVKEVVEIGAGGGGGTPGPACDSAYVYIAYASDDTGTDFTRTFDPLLDYIAVLTTTTQIATPVASHFAGLWKKYKGEPGSDGDSAYLYIAYASDDTGTDFSLSPGSSLTYIAALSTDTEIVTPQASDFTGLWRKYVGEDGAPADSTHYCYIAWRDAPGDGFTLTPNLNRKYEAILITHDVLNPPVEADFDGFWRPRFVPSAVNGLLPTGGTTGQVLKKQSDDDYDTDWEDESHLRAHQIDSADDHPPVPVPNRGKIVATKADTGEIEFLEKGSFDKYFRHSQALPSDFWMIEHNLSKLPSVTITDSSGNEIEGEVTHIDLNSLTVTFSAPFAGFADLN